MHNSACECCVGYAFVLLNAITVISAFTKCYSMSGQEYCFYTNGTVGLLDWNEAKQFCAKRNFKLPMIRDEVIDRVFQQFILDGNNAEVNGAQTERQINISVWLGAHARPVNDSVPWHWINGKRSGEYSRKFVNYLPAAEMRCIVISMAVCIVWAKT